MKTVTLKNGVAMEIRTPGADDAEAIIAYTKTIGGESDNLLFGPEGIPFTVEQEREFLTKIAAAKTSAMFAGIVAGKIAGLVNISAPTRERTAHNSEIGVSVLKEFWGLGVATALIGELIAFARASGIIRIIHLKVRADNVRAIRLYEKLGFAAIGRYREEIRIGDRFFDTLLMNKYL